ncbi:MAG: glycosyltransferase family 2 protein [Rhodothermales bacterium]|nr:glycosyltransferase family 2 protein [Rhodothermales bacterium]MBO6781304.1 glycosyltransferase family 2 protein [Rhodothermales bacterium]
MPAKPSIPERNTVALVIPLYNEADILADLVREIEQFRVQAPEVTEVVFVDDGSRDDTARLARELTASLSGYVLVRFSRNFGHQLAVTAGMHFVTADAAVILDADLQDPLPVVREMIDRWQEGYDVVYGVRRQRDGDSHLQQVTARAFYRVFRRMSDVDAPLDTGDFRLVSRPVLDAFRELGEQQPYVRGLVSWLGFNQIGVEYDRAPRMGGESKYAWRDRMRLALDGIASFSGRPLRVAVRIGLGVSALSVVGLVWVLIARLATDSTVPGWASILFVGFFFGGLQIFFLGVVGSYLARVYEEVKGRPRYVVREVWTTGNRREG